MVASDAVSTIVAFNITQLRDVDLDRFNTTVPTDRRERAARFVLLADRKRCLAAGVLLRFTLAKYAGILLDDVDVQTNAFGKPFVASRGGVHFNLSHAGDWVVCGISKTEIGVDIERIDTKGAGIARRFAPDEYLYVAAETPVESPRRFAQVWTLKESYMKYLGRGLGVPLDSFSVRAENGRPRILRGSLDSRPTLKHVVHDGDYYVAECCADDTAIELERPGAEELLAACP